jgi:hypothetical protein
MNAVTEQLDRQTDERFRRAVQNSNEERTDSSVYNETRGAQIIQTNTLSTAALVALLVALFVSASSGMLAIGMAWNALDMAHQAEREGRLAQERADRLEVDVKVMLALQEKAH